MTKARRIVRQTLTIARRDFIATVFTPIFLLFLFAPVLMGVFGGVVGGLGAASVASGAADKARMVAIVGPRDARTIVHADALLRTAFRDETEAPPALVTIPPAADPAAQARAAFDSADYDAAAVLYGPLDHPRILYAARGRRAADILTLLAQAALDADRLGPAAPRVVATRTAYARTGHSIGGQNQAAFFSVLGVFFLTLFLSGQVVGTMAEERNSKVIEVLAAAVPLESVFMGKLLGMFGAALTFVAFWGTVISQVGRLMPSGSAIMADLQPAIGFPIWIALFFAYFTMAYLLLGAVFLGVGAQASSQREIQMLSLPITILQVAMFGLASAAVSYPDSWLATVARIFPLSSPFAMAGLAASAPAIWPHLLALAWQALWVAIFITLGARAFRRGVLSSGSAKFRVPAVFARR